MRFPTDVPVLTDGRVTLRAHRLADLEGMYEQCVDPETQRWTSVPALYTREHAEQFLASRAEVWESATAWSFAVETDGGAGPSRFAGSIGVRNHGGGLGEIGFGLHPVARGRGVATAAVRLILDWAFEVQQARTIVWKAPVGNVASRRVAWRTGFTFEGLSRASLFRRGQLVDAWRATVLSTDSRDPKTRWLDPVVMHGDHILLRGPSPADEQRYVETTTDPASLRWLGTIAMPRDIETFRALYPQHAVGNSLGSSVEWVIAAPDTGAYLGSISVFGLHSLDYLSAEVGYRTHPDARGRGALTEGLRLVIGHAFRSVDQGGLGLERMSLGAGDGNLASQRVARSLGFTETGRDRRCYDLDDGSVVDLVRFDLLKSEFDAANG